MAAFVNALSTQIQCRHVRQRGRRKEGRKEKVMLLMSEAAAALLIRSLKHGNAQSLPLFLSLPRPVYSASRLNTGSSKKN